MKKIILAILFSSVLAAQFCNAKANTTSIQYVKLTPKTIKLDFPNLKNCSLAKEIKKNKYLLDCENPKKDTEYNYGRRLYLIDISYKNPQTLFEGYGEMDAYAILTTLYSSLPPETDIFILAEITMEYSLGVRVYILSQNKMKWVGHIEAKLPKTGESAISNVLIKKTKKQYIFTFNSDVDVQYDKNIQDAYFTVPKDEIRYILKNGKMERILSSRMNEVMLRKRKENK